jgi:hypothetical protein
VKQLVNHHQWLFYVTNIRVSYFPIIFMEKTGSTRATDDAGEPAQRNDARERVTSLVVAPFRKQRHRRRLRSHY